MTTSTPNDASATSALALPSTQAATPQPAPDPAEPATGARRKDPAAEAAARRHELRAEQAARAADVTAAAEREALLVAKITGYQRNAIEQYLAGTTDVRGDGTNAPSLHRPADLWDVLGAVSPDEFYDDTGALDTTALADFIAEGTAGRDYLARAFVEGVPPINAVRDALSSQQPPAFDAPAKRSWQQALHGTV